MKTGSEKVLLAFLLACHEFFVSTTVTAHHLECLSHHPLTDFIMIHARHETHTQFDDMNVEILVLLCGAFVEASGKDCFM